MKVTRSAGSSWKQMGLDPQKSMAGGVPMIQREGCHAAPSPALLGMVMAAPLVTATSDTHCSRQLLALQPFSRSYNECMDR